jgi:putative sigma-54 modulation protein
MELRITARHFDLSEDIKGYAEKRILPLTRYFDRIMDSHLILSVEKHQKKAELSMGVFGQTLVAHSETDDVYSCIDGVTEKMERQLTKYNDRITDHRK